MDNIFGVKYPTMQKMLNPQYMVVRGERIAAAKEYSLAIQNMRSLNQEIGVPMSLDEANRLRPVAKQLRGLKEFIDCFHMSEIGRQIAHEWSVAFDYQACLREAGIRDS